MSKGEKRPKDETKTELIKKKKRREQMREKNQNNAAKKKKIQNGRGYSGRKNAKQDERKKNVGGDLRKTWEMKKRSYASTFSKITYPMCVCVFFSSLFLFILRLSAPLREKKKSKKKQKTKKSQHKDDRRQQKQTEKKKKKRENK